MASPFNIKRPDMNEFLSRKVDLLKYFSVQEVDNMRDVEKKRYKNIIQNYDMMVLMGLPAIKPECMKGVAYRARRAKIQEQLEYVQPSSDSDSTDDEWTPYVEKKKSQKGMKRKSGFKAPVSRPVKAKLERVNPKKTVQKPKKPEKESKSYELRERKINFMNLEPPDEDHFLYCEECNKEYDMDCPVHGPMDYIQDKQTDKKPDPDRALHSLPDGLVVKESSIYGAGLGVFTEKEIPARTMFGPYGGVKVTDSGKAHQSGYCWQVYENGKASHFVDAQDKMTSNWMRYVNCALSDSDQNLVAFQYKGGIYYRTYRPVLPGKELLVWYGDEYGRELGLVRDKNLLFRPSYVNGEVYFPCVFCKAGFSTAPYCVRHLMRMHGRDKLTADDIQVLDAWLRENKYYRYSENRDAESSDKNHETDKSLFIHIGRTNTADFNKENTQNMLYENINERIDSKQYIAEHLLNDELLKQNGKESIKSTLSNSQYAGQKNSYKCDVCGFACNKNDVLTKHKRTHTGDKPYKCDVCGYACNQSDTLTAHKRTHTGNKPYKCDVCGYACNESGALTTHKRKHTGDKPYKCDVCGYACKQLNNLTTHKRTHTGDKPYKCDVCGYACKQLNNLTTHKRTHTEDKPYKCDVCGYACNNSHNLTRHKRTHTGDKPYKCDVCGYACSCSHVLTRHKRIHTGDKPYKCDVCGYACKQLNNLTRHKRTHTGDKPYKCDVCGYACNQSGHLTTHKITHTGDKPYKCDVCGYACNENGTLTRHKRTHTAL